MVCDKTNLHTDLLLIVRQFFCLVDHTKEFLADSVGQELG